MRHALATCNALRSTVTSTYTGIQKSIEHWISPRVCKFAPRPPWAAGALGSPLALSLTESAAERFTLFSPKLNLNIELVLSYCMLPTDCSS